ncbi:hypothetical protein BDA99DRAFT_570202 [Phascolomyces articulosus]|uniref:RRM domain-containing protein n=1 Tax=Phascolomyces articulosus TaxID=60185 RepID=A0AAD5PGB9_9FUNG|nr:hypothetical protein BDA99DRAFT_570202 [Phascolomyces articulosus]
MSSAMDLDSSLDDIIKKRKNNSSKNQKNKQQQQRSNKQNQGNNNKRVGSGRRNNNNNNSNNRGNASNNSYNNNNGRRNGRGNNNALSLSSNSKTINKSSRNNNPIARRTGQQQQKQQQQQQRQKYKNVPASTSSNAIDPSKIVITKKVSRNNNNKKNNNSNNNVPMNNGRMNPFSNEQAPTQTPINRGLAIRGASYGSSSMMYSNGVSNGISIRGESGPAVVLIRNLDPGVNAEDIRMICVQFGQVSNCEVAVDQMGRSFGEAEVEFVQKQAALDCINKLDNEVADGRHLRAILRDRPSGVVNGYMNQPVRSMIAPTRSGFTSA